MLILILSFSNGWSESISHQNTNFENSKEELLKRIQRSWADQIQTADSLQDKTTVDLISHDGHTVVHGGYVVTSPNNPLIDKSCRAGSLADAIVNLKKAENLELDEAFSKADNHIKQQQYAFGKRITFTKWLKHVAECKDFCNFAVLKLLRCHVETVAKNHHSLVAFDYNKSNIKTGHETQTVQRFVDIIQQKENNQGIVLIGRASRTGNAEYNRKLSKQRVESVSKLIQSYGVSEKFITLQPLGYEEPQLDAWLTKYYGLEMEYAQLGGDRINQSVLMVMY